MSSRNHFSFARLSYQPTGGYPIGDYPGELFHRLLPTVDPRRQDKDSVLTFPVELSLTVRVVTRFSIQASSLVAVRTIKKTLVSCPGILPRRAHDTILSRSLTRAQDAAKKRGKVVQDLLGSDPSFIGQSSAARETHDLKDWSQW